MNNGFVYILTNKHRNVLYIGVTNDLQKRVAEHKAGEGSVFTKRYIVHYLVWFEHHSNIMDAIAREKQLKNHHREWKYNLIRSENPDMIDLYDGLDSLLNHCNIKRYCEDAKRVGHIDGRSCSIFIRSKQKITQSIH